MMCLYKISACRFTRLAKVMKRVKNVIKLRNIRVCDCLLMG